MAANFLCIPWVFPIPCMFEAGDFGFEERSLLRYICFFTVGFSNPKSSLSMNYLVTARFWLVTNPQISSETNCSTSRAVEFVGSTTNHLVLYSCTVVEKQVVFVLTGTGTSVLWNQCQFLQVGYHMITHDILFPVFLLHSTWQ